MSHEGLGRACVAAGALMAWLSLLSTFNGQGVAHPRGLSDLLPLSWATQPLVGATATGLVVIALVAWVSRRRPAPAALLVTGLLALGAHLDAAQVPALAGGNHAVVLPGAALLAWVLGDHLANWRGGPEQAGFNAACGVAAACYLAAGTGKLLGSGLAWAQGGNLALHILVHNHGETGALGVLRLGLAELPWLCTLLGHGTLLIECGMVFFVLPTLRRPLAALVVAMHLGISLFMGLHHFDWMLVVLGLGLMQGLRSSD